MTSKFFEVQKKIYLADTDVTGIAYYAKHLEWQEVFKNWEAKI
jgi:acyl-CoA thioesterase FadM